MEAAMTVNERVTPSSPVRSTLVVCAISAAISGVAIRIPFPEGTFLAQPLNYLPGWVFGLCYAWARMRGSWRIVLFTIGSGLIYQGAVQIYMLMMSAGSADASIGLLPSALAGAFGGFALVVLTKLLSALPIGLDDELRTLVIGAVTGMIFTTLLFLPPEFLWGVLAYAIWQMPVGWSLMQSTRGREKAAGQPEPARPPGITA
jgi:hypothetical protein